MFETFQLSDSWDFLVGVLGVGIMCWFGETTQNQSGPQFPNDVCFIGLYNLHMEQLPCCLAKAIRKLG
jgi:hypothetical protein